MSTHGVKIRSIELSQLIDLNSFLSGRFPNVTYDYETSTLLVEEVEVFCDVEDVSLEGLEFLHFKKCKFFSSFTRFKDSGVLFFVNCSFNCKQSDGRIGLQFDYLKSVVFKKCIFNNSARLQCNAILERINFFDISFRGERGGLGVNFYNKLPENISIERSFFTDFMISNIDNQIESIAHFSKSFLENFTLCNISRLTARVSGCRVLKVKITDTVESRFSFNLMEEEIKSFEVKNCDSLVLKGLKIMGALRITDKPPLAYLNINNVEFNSIASSLWVVDSDLSNSFMFYVKFNGCSVVVENSIFNDLTFGSVDWETAHFSQPDIERLDRWNIYRHLKVSAHKGRDVKYFQYFYRKEMEELLSSSTLSIGDKIVLFANKMTGWGLNWLYPFGWLVGVNVVFSIVSISFYKEWGFVLDLLDTFLKFLSPFEREKPSPFGEAWFFPISVINSYLFYQLVVSLRKFNIRA